MLSILGSSSSQSRELLLYKNGKSYVNWTGDYTFRPDYIKLNSTMYSAEEVELSKYSYLVITCDVINYEMRLSANSDNDTEYSGRMPKGENVTVYFENLRTGILRIKAWSAGNGRVNIKEIKAIP